MVKKVFTMLAIDLSEDSTKLACWVKSTREGLADTSEIIKNDMNNSSIPYFLVHPLKV